MNNREEIPNSREFFKNIQGLDPESRLEEFNKHVARMKASFDNARSTRPWMTRMNAHPFTSESTSYNAPSPNGHVPVEKTIPIHVQHERTRSEPMDGNSNIGQTENVPNNDKAHFMPYNMQDRMCQPTFSNEAAADSSAEPRVHRIPINVESTQNSFNQKREFMEPKTAPTTTAYTSFTNRTPDPSRVIEVPIQITKSSSTPETVKKCESNVQQANSNVPQTANVCESSSDPAIADPNQVFVMGYEPLNTNNDGNSNSSTNAANKTKETPFDFVDEILHDLRNYEGQVHEFNGTTPEDKGYRFLDEMLTLCILRLDCINIDGNDELRKYRKSAINEVNRVAAILETKVSRKGAATSEAPNEANMSETDSPMAQSNGEVGQSTPANAEDSDSKKDGKKPEKAKGQKKRLLIFRGKNKNKTPEANSGEPASMDVDPNNNDLKNDSNQSNNEQNSDTASTSSSSTLQGKETAV